MMQALIAIQAGGVWQPIITWMQVIVGSPGGRGQITSMRSK